jgi:hypothetical protein
MNLKAIRFNGEISTISAKKDKSLGLRLLTPELSVTEKADIMELQGVNVDVWIKPLDIEPIGIVEIDKDLEQLTHSQRQRRVLYVLWDKEGRNGEFDSYYKIKMEKNIEYIKSKIKELE